MCGVFVCVSVCRRAFCRGSRGGRGVEVMFVHSSTAIVRCKLLLLVRNSLSLCVLKGSRSHILCTHTRYVCVMSHSGIYPGPLCTHTHTRTLLRIQRNCYAKRHKTTHLIEQMFAEQLQLHDQLVEFAFTFSHR